LVGTLTIQEKKITREDLDSFILTTSKYFVQYEKLNAINEQFAQELQDLLEKSEEAKEDLKEFLVECISMMNTSLTKQSLKGMQVEYLIQKYYDPQKLQMWLDTAHITNDKLLYPPDAPTSVKLLTSQIKKLQKEFENVYQENYKELKELIASLKTSIPNLDQEQIEKTKVELDRLYSDSRQADIINLNINLVDERMNTVCRNINSGN